MSDFEKSRQTWLQKLAAYSILWKTHNTLPIAFDERFRGAYSGTRDPKEFMSDFERHLQHLDSPSRSRIRRLLANRLKALASGRKPTSTLEQRLNELLESCQISLAAIPPSLDKARGSLMAVIDVADFESNQEYDVACLLREHVTQEVITRVVAEWKEELRRSLEDSFRPRPPIFWVSRDFMETLDAISRYCFMEVFGIGEFPETVTAIEHMFASAIMEADPGVIASLLGDSKWGTVVFDLWLASRSAMLCGRIRNFVEIALTRIANHQSVKGWWYSPIANQVSEQHGQFMPDNYPTALSCVVLLKLSRSNWQLARARQGVQWLAKQQQPSGAWVESYQVAGPKLDLLTTVLAAEAIRLSGLDGYDHTVSMADSWIMSQQAPDGTWGDEAFPFPFMTVLVVEYFERKRPPLSSLGSYLSIARDFILRSRELVLEDNENARRLAIVVAFQGIEAFLYACLSHSSINMKIFEKPDKTIGMRKALTKLQTHLQAIKVLKQEQVIEYRNELDRLAYHRDQIVHKAASIGEKEARELIETSARFSELTCQRIFGHSLL